MEVGKGQGGRKRRPWRQAKEAMEVKRHGGRK